MEARRLLLCQIAFHTCCETRVRFPSPAPLFSSANSQFFQATVLRVSSEAARISPVSLGFQRRNRNRGSGAHDSTDGLALYLIHCRKKHGAPRLDREGRGAGWRPFPRFLGFTVAVAAKRAVVPPAGLGPWTSVVGWPGMSTIWRRASVIPQGKERQEKPGPPSAPWPRRTQASPTAVPSLAGRHLGPLTGGSAGLPGSMGVPTGHHGPWQAGGQR